MTVYRFGFALAGFIVVAILINEADERGNTDYLTWYTAIIWLTFATAQRQQLAGEFNKLVALSRSGPLPTGGAGGSGNKGINSRPGNKTQSSGNGGK